MIVKREEPITKEQFRKNFDKVLKAAGEGKGPIAITDDAEVVGFLVGPEMYDQFYAEEIEKMLKRRLKQKKTISAQEVRHRISAVIARHRQK